jgi:hypothetical protein
MRSTIWTFLGIGVLGLILSTTLAIVGAADDVKNVVVGNKSFQARTVNDRTFLTKGIDKPVVRTAGEVGADPNQEERKRLDLAIEQRRRLRKDTAAKLKAEFDHLTQEGKHEAAATVKQDLTINYLEGHVENFSAFIDEYFRENERLLERIDTLEKRIKELEARTSKIPDEKEPARSSRRF